MNADIAITASSPIMQITTTSVGELLIGEIVSRLEKDYHGNFIVGWFT